MLRDCSGDLVWNSNEAYLFFGCGTLGYRISYLAYPFELIKEHLGAAPQPDNTKLETIVIQIKPSAVIRYAQEEPSLDLFTPLAGTIFANHQGTLWKWSVSRFVEASREEEQKLQGTRSLTGLNLDDKNGWSKRTAILSQTEGETKIPLEISGQHFVLAVRREKFGESVSINLVRSDNSTEQIWHIDRRPRSLNRNEYDQLFSRNSMGIQNVR